MSEAEDATRERDAATLGRHYVAGHLEAGDFSTRLDALYVAFDEETRGAALAGLPPLDPTAPAPVDSPRSWWRRRHGESDGPHPGWLPTLERFMDPTTDRIMRVWLDPETRTRHYVADGGA